ncbi:helix-turn-helix domain-containing protein [Candidatus Woesearchaeota archaeon]|jgi:excisionase family DNA binding protein|nr:helix-turn-helix domain-containing protein [Candidatus Woesearchaeota archaeon]
MKDLLGISFYYLDEVAAKFQVNERTVRRWITSGKLEAMKWGGRWLIAESDIKEFIKQRLNTSSTV